MNGCYVFNIIMLNMVVKFGIDILNKNEVNGLWYYFWFCIFCIFFGICFCIVFIFCYSLYNYNIGKYVIDILFLLIGVVK